MENSIDKKIQARRHEEVTELLTAVKTALSKDKSDPALGQLSKDLKQYFSNFERVLGREMPVPEVTVHTDLKEVVKIVGEVGKQYADLKKENAELCKKFDSMIALLEKKPESLEVVNREYGGQIKKVKINYSK